VLAVD